MIYQNDDFRYDSETGELRWNRDVIGGKGAVRFRKGTPCSRRPDANGYLVVRCRGEAYYQHQVIWFLVYGYWPVGIDHISRIKVNNRLNNLREASKSENAKNAKLSSTNTSGFTGVCWDSQTSKWRAQIKTKDRNHLLGRFDRKEDAIAARQAANVKYGFSPRHGKRL